MAHMTTPPVQTHTVFQIFGLGEVLSDLQGSDGFSVSFSSQSFGIGGSV